MEGAAPRRRRGVHSRQLCGFPQPSAARLTFAGVCHACTSPSGPPSLTAPQHATSRVVDPPPRPNSWPTWHTTRSPTRRQTHPLDNVAWQPRGVWERSARAGPALVIIAGRPVTHREVAAAWPVTSLVNRKRSHGASLQRIRRARPRLPTVPTIDTVAVSLLAALHSLKYTTRF